MTKLISVIVPIFRVEDYLSRCINSILHSTYRNLEVILVNDGSPDNCPGICDNYARIDPRIKVIHKENGGLSDARNAGLEIATGEYVCFIDSDDFINSVYIERLYQLIDEHNADIAVCDYFSFGKEEEIKPQIQKIYIEDCSNVQALAKLYSGNDYLKTVVVWNKLYKKDLWNDIRFPKGKVHEDELTTYKVLYFANRIIYSNEKLYFYFQRSGSITGAGFNANRLIVFDALTTQMDFFSNKNELKLVNLVKERYIIVLICYFYFVRKCDLPNKKDLLHQLMKIVFENYNTLKRCDMGVPLRIRFYLLKNSPKMFFLLYSLENALLLRRFDFF